MLSNIINKIVYRLKKRLEEQNFIDREVIISSSSFISGSILRGHVRISEKCKVYQSHIEGRVTIGKYTSVWGPNIAILSKINSIKIGAFCSIAKNVSIQEYNHKHDSLSTYHLNSNVFNGTGIDDICSKGGIVIGNDVWVGDGSMILSGVSIGNGAVIAARSVVTKNIPPFAIVGGNPAKIIKYRFDPDEIVRIEKMKWWDWPKDKILNNRHIF